jgi:hypothetical protein
MSCNNPTHGRRTVPFELSVAQTAILYDELTGWIVGIEEDLEESGRRVDADLAIREAEAFGRLLVALDHGEVTLPDDEARAAMEKAAEGYEDATGIEGMLAVHHAHRALLDVLAGAGTGCAR